jgi:glycine oxidase
VAPSSDVVVIGAGIIGCAVAYELARRGATVDVVDDRPIGMGATQASAGVLAPYIEAREGSALLDLTVRSLALFDRFVEQVRDSSGLPVTYSRSGTFEVATTPEALARLEAAARVLSRCGVVAELCDEAGARREEPHLTAGALGGLLVRAHGFVGAAALTEALAAAARRHGARFRQGGRAGRITQVGGDLTVDTAAGSVSGRGVVLAAGCWSGQVAVAGRPAALPVRPVRGQLLQLTWSGPPIQRVLWGDRCYLVPWDDGTLLVGATVEDTGFDERTTVAGVRNLLDAACELVPHAWTAGFSGARAGLRPATPDEVPVIGASTILPNLVYATGHYRNGILLSPLTASLVADLVLERRADPLLAATQPERFGAL